MTPAFRLLGGLLIVLALTGCMGSSGNNDDAPVISHTPTPVLHPDDPWLGGYYWGGASYDGTDHPAEALVLQDGTLRMTLGGPGDTGGSVQFIGHFQTDGDHADGEGIIIGQECWSPTESRFCGMAVPAFVSLTEPASSLEPNHYRELYGDITITLDDATESWPVYFDYGRKSSPAYSNLWRDLHGVYGESSYGDPSWDTFGTDVVVNVDNLGQVFFQSAETGCVGNGSLVLYGDGSAAVFSVSLLVQNCDGDRANLNGALEGLARYWFDSFDGAAVLYVLLSGSPEQDVPVAATSQWWSQR